MYAFLAFALLLTASYFDLKDRRIPPTLSYSFILIGLTAHLLEGISLQYIYIVFASFFFAYALYKFGVWAGGDFKLFVALSLLLPTYKSIDFFSFYVLFFAVLAVLPFLLVFFAYKLFLSKEFRRGAKAKAKSWLKRSLFIAIIATASYELSSFFTLPPELSVLFFFMLFLLKQSGSFIAVVFLLNSIIRNPSYVLTVIYLFLVSLLISIAIYSFKVLRKTVLRKKLPIAKIKEGMIPAQHLIKKGKRYYLKEAEWRDLFHKDNIVIDSMKARGLNRDEILLIKKSGIKEIEIKKSLPFVPFMCLGFVLALLSLFIF